MTLTRIVFFKDVPIQQALFGKRRTMGIACAAALELLIGIACFGIGFQVVHHGMPHRIGKSGLLPPEDLIGQDPVFLERMAKKVFAHAIPIELQFRVNPHYILHKIQIAEWHTGFQGVYGDAAVSPQHIIHVQLVDPLLALQLEGLRRWGEVGVFVPEQFVGNLPGQQNTDVRVLVDCPAAQIHAQACPNGRNIPGAEQPDNLVECVKHFFPAHMKCSVFCPDVVCGDLRVFQVDGVKIHANGKGSDLSPEKFC